MPHFRQCLQFARQRKSDVDYGHRQGRTQLLVQTADGYCRPMAVAESPHWHRSSCLIDHCAEVSDGIMLASQCSSDRGLASGRFYG